jgi:hypothetical protein
MILARLEPRDYSDRRSSPRRRLNLDVAGSTRTFSDVEVVVLDLSVTGLLIEAAVDLQTGDELTIAIPDSGAVDAVVVWKSGNYFGCEFATPIPNAALSAASLRSVPDPRPENNVALSPAQPVSTTENAYREDDLSPRGKLLALFGLSLAAWAVIALVVWLILALVWG